MPESSGTSVVILAGLLVGALFVAAACWFGVAR